ncbi:unnamed protein product, partial [Adineta ricciae]
KLQTDFQSTGSIRFQSYINPFSFQMMSTLSELLCSIAYLMFIIYMMIEIIQSIRRMKIKYFHDVWSYINMGIIICSWTSLLIFGLKYQESKAIGKFFKETNGYDYIDLEYAVSLDQLLKNFLSLALFLGWIKFVRLCRFNRRISLFIQTLQHASRALWSFSLMFGVIFIAFLCLFYLLFISKLSTCADLYRTAIMLYEMVLMNFDAHELINGSSFLGPFVFTLFILIAVFICLSMFLTIINESFRYARDNLKSQRTEDEIIFTFMMKRFQCWIGISNDSHERDGMMREKYYTPTDAFPNKVDQLLTALDRIYTNQRQ